MEIRFHYKIIIILRYYEYFIIGPRNDPRVTTGALNSKHMDS